MRYRDKMGSLLRLAPPACPASPVQHAPQPRLRGLSPAASDHGPSVARLRAASPPVSAGVE